MRTMAVDGAPLIEMIDVGKLYGNIRALQGISLKVGAGEVTCVLGDNGAGKSSLIKIMSGVHQHDEGTYKVEGEEVRFMPSVSSCFAGPPPFSDSEPRKRLRHTDMSGTTARSW